MISPLFLSGFLGLNPYNLRYCAFVAVSVLKLIATWPNCLVANQHLVLNFDS